MSHNSDPTAGFDYADIDTGGPIESGLDTLVGSTAKEQFDRGVRAVGNEWFDESDGSGYILTRRVQVGPDDPVPLATYELTHLFITSEGSRAEIWYFTPGHRQLHYAICKRRPNERFRSVRHRLRHPTVMMTNPAINPLIIPVLKQVVNEALEAREG